MLSALTTKVLQPQLAHATRFVARSSPLTKSNKKHPSNDECFLLAGDEARTRDILLGKTINMNKHEAFSLFSALLNKILIPRKIIHRLHIGYMDFEPRLLLIYLRIIL